LQAPLKRSQVSPNSNGLDLGGPKRADEIGDFGLLFFMSTLEDNEAGETEGALRDSENRRTCQSGDGRDLL